MTPSRGDPAALVAAEWVRRRPPSSGCAPGAAPAALVMGDPSPALPDALRGSGRSPTAWSRRLAPGQLCAPWPPGGPFAEAWLRMPRSAAEAAMLLHAGAARLPPGGQLLLYGANDEGIRSGARHFPPGAAPVRTLLAKRRCRVLAATIAAPAAPASASAPDAPAGAAPAPDALAHWHIRAPVDWGTGEREWTFYPGVFACGRLDPATALLIDSLPPVAAAARVLDFGAGTGFIAAAVLERAPQASATLLDNDAAALAAAAQNVPAPPPPGPGGAPRVSHVLADSLAAAPGPFDLIVSNPPIHAGGAHSLATVAALVRDAPAALVPGGRLVLVAQRRLPLPRLLHESFGNVRAVADRGPFRVWSARRGRRQPYRPSM